MSIEPIDPTKPDLEESTNVAEQHAEVQRSASAASREQSLRENGLEPTSVWIYIGAAIVALVAGSVLFKGNWFGYDSYVKDGYVQADDPNPVESVPKGEAHDVYMGIGGAKYAQKCASCHGPGGAGVGAAFPPLAGSEWVTESPIIPVLIGIHGVSGDITVAGKKYSGNMPSQGIDGWSNLELASLVYYLQNSWGNKVGKVYTPEQMEQIRKISDARAGGACTAAELEKYKGQQLEGEFYEKGTVINKKDGSIIQGE